MTVRIDHFKSALIGGGARPNYFRVMPAWPAGTPNTGSAAGDLVTLGSFMIKGAMLPASTITPIEVPFRGRQLKVAGDRVFEEWQITVINDNNFAVRNAFEWWMNEINGHVSNESGSLGSTVDASNLSSYVQNWTVQQLDRSGNVVKSYTMVGAFPTALDGIQLDYGAGDIEEFGVSMSYQYWTSTTGAIGGNEVDTTDNNNTTT